MRGQEALLLAQQKLKLIANRDEQKEELKNIVLMQRKRAEKAKNLIALVQERKAVLQNAIAEELANGATEKSVTVRQKRAALIALDTRETALNTVATNANTAAQEAQRAVMASTPWGLIALAITGVVYGLTRLGAESRKTKKEIADINKRIGEETTEAKLLFIQLEKVEKGSREYKTTLAQLNAMYPDIIAKYRDEEGALTDVAAARQEVIDKITEQIAAESQLAKMRSIGGEFEAGTKGSAQKIYDYLNGDTAKYAAVMAALPKGYEKELTQEDIKGIYAAVETATGIDLGAVFGWNRLKRAVDGYIHSVNEAYKAQQKWSGIYKGFGVSGEQPSTAAGLDLGGDGGNGGNGGGGGTAADPAELERAAKAQARVLEQMAKLTTQLEERALSGVEQKIVEITDKVEAMKKELQEAFGGKLSKKAQNALVDLEAAAFRAKDAAVNRYMAEAIKTVTREGAKNDSSAGNELLREIENATDRLTAKLDQMDAQRKAWEASAAYMESQGMTAEAQQLRDLIKQYDTLRQKKIDAAYVGVNTSWAGTTLGKKQGANVSAEAEGIVAGSGPIARLAGMSYAKDVQQVLNSYAEAYTEVTEKITAQEEKMAAAKAAGVSDEVLSGMQAELALLNEQAAGLEELKQKALELAEAEALRAGLNKLSSTFDKLFDQITSAWEGINTILDNVGKKQLKVAKERKEGEEALLDEQLNQGLISQDEYNDKKEKLQKEYDDKEKALSLAQWKRQKALNISQATMEGAIAVLRALATPPVPNKLLATITGALAAVQVAAVASEPAPYAEGGYVPRRTYFVAGEAGEEWVASHQLLSDPRTAPVIEALESYQRGGGLELPYANMDVAGMGAAADGLAASRAEQREMLAVMKDLAGYLKDPANRRAVISRKTQLMFEDNENFLWAAARL